MGVVDISVCVLCVCGVRIDDAKGRELKLFFSLFWACSQILQALYIHKEEGGACCIWYALIDFIAKP